MNWIRYRFKTKSVEDWRPLIYNPAYPSWCSGYSGDGESAIIVAYLPVGENLLKYWDDAFQIEEEECEKIVFTDRFPMTKGFTGESVSMFSKE